MYHGKRRTCNDYDLGLCTFRYWDGTPYECDHNFTRKDWRNPHKYCAYNNIPKHGKKYYNKRLRLDGRREMKGSQWKKTKYANSWNWL